jgi:hypothetical protein
MQIEQSLLALVQNLKHLVNLAEPLELVELLIVAMMTPPHKSSMSRSRHPNHLSERSRGRDALSLAWTGGLGDRYISGFLRLSMTPVTKPTVWSPPANRACSILMHRF